LTVVADATFTLAPGEAAAITGPSGSGKSSLLSMLGCILQPTAGELRINGSRVEWDERLLPQIRRDYLGFVFQGFNLLSRTSALDNVELPLLYRSVGAFRTSERHRRALAALDAVGLGERYHHMPNQLSGGQQQRVAIARALINEPSILLADEPTGNLDTRTSIEVMGIFQRLNEERGITVLLITHEMDIAEYGTRLIRFRDGRVVADQPVLHRRNAAEELEALPPPEPDQIPPKEAAAAAH
jgi:putative ABC transport system ATP-binding protein